MVLRKRITPKFNHDLVDVDTSGLNLKSKLVKADKTCAQWSIKKPNSLFEALSTQEGSQQTPRGLHLLKSTRLKEAPATTIPSPSKESPKKLDLKGGSSTKSNTVKKRKRQSFISKLSSASKAASPEQRLAVANSDLGGFEIRCKDLKFLASMPQKKQKMVVSSTVEEVQSVKEEDMKQC